MFCRFLLFCILTLGVQARVVVFGEEVNVSKEVAWASRYMQNGHQVAQDAYVTASLYGEWRNAELGLLQGYAPNQDFQQTAIDLSYGYELTQELTLDLGYATHTIQERDKNWQDVTLTLECHKGHLSKYLMAHYNVESKGFLFEAGIEYELQFKSKVSVTPYVEAGVVSEYETPVFAGEHYLQVGVAIGYEVGENLQAELSVHRCFRISGDSSAPEKNWIQVGLSQSF